MRTLKKQVPELEQALASGGSVTIQSVEYRALGVGLILFGLGAIVDVLIHGPWSGDYLGDWIYLSIAFLPLVIVGAYLAQWGSMTVGRDGIRVVNPINEAWIPWRDLVSVSAGGPSLRLRTDSWSIGVISIERRRYSQPGKTTPDRIAYLLQAEADRRRSQPSTDDVPPRAVKNWKWRPGALAIVAGIDLVAFVYEVVMHAPWSMY